MYDPVDLLSSQKIWHNILCVIVKQATSYCVLIFKIGVNQQSHVSGIVFSLIPRTHLEMLLTFVCPTLDGTLFDPLEESPYPIIFSIFSTIECQCSFEYLLDNSSNIIYQKSQNIVFIDLAAILPLYIS